MADAKHTPRFQVRSLGPAFWYVCDTAKAQQTRSRGQVGRPHATRADAERAIAKATGSAS